MESTRLTWGWCKPALMEHSWESVLTWMLKCNDACPGSMQMQLDSYILGKSPPTLWTKVHLRSENGRDSQSARWPSRALVFRQHDWWLYSKVRPKSQDKRRKSQASINLTKHQSHWLRWRVKTKTVNLANFSQANLLTKVEVESMAINSSGPLVQAVWLITDISLADGSQTSSEICWLTLKCKCPLPS